MTNKQLFALFAIAIGALVTWSCQRKYACSAYQSVFILDQSNSNQDVQAFAFMRAEDSTPVDQQLTRKNKVLLIKPTTKRKKEKSWDIIRMETKFPPMTAEDSAMRALIDSLKQVEASYLDSNKRKEQRADSARTFFEEDVPDEYKKAYIDTVEDTRTPKEKRRDAKRAAKEAKRAAKAKEREKRKAGDGDIPADQPVADPAEHGEQPREQPKKGKPKGKEEPKKEEPVEGF